MAELLRQSLGGSETAEVRSAGFHSKSGRPLTAEFAVRLKHRHMIDLAAHRSRVVAVGDIEWADTIIVMDRHNWHAVAQLAPDQLGKVVWLGAFLESARLEILDPYGSAENEVDEIIGDILEAVPRFVSEIGAARRSRGAN